jgi:hypothetical protein
MNFELTVDEANVILLGLSKLPYEASAGVIQTLQTQAQGQLPQPPVEQPVNTNTVVEQA